MSTEYFLSASRSIEQLGVETPLLVPSYSSRGFPEVAALFEGTRNNLYGICLVSAFDVATRRVPVDIVDVADVVVLDSGVYETKPIVVAADGYHPPAAASSWERNSYRTFLRTVDAAANVLAVSFDQYGPVGQQIELAQEDFACGPTAVGDFLLKPPAVDAFIDGSQVGDQAGALSRFGVVGVTERELGNSFLDRCRSLIGLRAQFERVGSTVPIHVFGTITPGAVLAYFFCGADVFDGLNWLRFAYATKDLCPIPESALEADQWARPDEDCLIGQARRNLRFLHRLQEAMRRFAKTGDFDSLAAAFPAAQAAARVALAAGSRLPGDRSE